MKITIFAAGSRGDIQPCIALSQGLRQAGYQVQLAAPEDFAGFAREHAVDFYPLRGDVQRLMASDTGRKFMQSGGANPLKSIRAIRTLVAPVIAQMTDDAYAACRETDALICLGVQSAFGQTIAEALRLPVINLEPTPLLPTRAFAAPSWPLQKNLGGLHNYLSGLAMLQVVWQWYHPFVNEFRQRLGLRAVNAAQAYRALRSTPMVSAYSSTIIPHPSDWPASVHVTGYLFLADDSAWQPPAELQAFLEAGDPPVYIGFGSMSSEHPAELMRLILDALAIHGRRAVVHSGWAGLASATLPANVLTVGSLPHAWLFPRVSAIVHHGGAGTTAAAVRAGKPAVVVPFHGDQPFWARLAHQRGVATAPLPRRELTAQRLAEAIEHAVGDVALRRTAADLGARVGAEDGVSAAVAVIEAVGRRDGVSPAASAQRR